MCLFLLMHILTCYIQNSLSIQPKWWPLLSLIQCSAEYYHLTYRNEKRFYVEFYVDMGSRDGTVVRTHISHQCSLGSNPGPGVKSGLSLLLGLALLQGVFSRFSGFPSYTKTNTSKVWFNLETMNKKPLCGMCHCKFLYI